MIDATKTNHISLFLAFATAVGLLLVFLASGFIFTSSNPVSKFAMLGGGILFLIGAIHPRQIIVLLVPISFYLDGLKRLLVLVGRTGLDDVTSVLAVAPLAAVGVIIGCVIRRIFFRRRSEPVERLIFVSAMAAFVAFGGMEAFTAGNLLFGLRTAANSTVYFLLPWAVFECYRTREEIERFLKFCLIVGVPVALYGIWQYSFGLNQVEITYLQSGLTMTGVNLLDVRPRPFSTLGSPHSYSNVMMFMTALSLHFTSAWTARRGTWKANVIAIIYAVSVLLSMGRGAVFGAIGMIVFARLFRSARGVLVAYAGSALFIGGIIFFAQSLMDSLGKLQSLLPSGSGWKEQAFRLETFSDRLMGYQNVLSNPGSWPLFANPLNFHPAEMTASDTQFSHDLLSQMILRIGAVPVFLGACAALYFLRLSHRAILRLPGGKTGIRPLGARLMAIIFVFLLSQAAGAGITVFPMNFWTGIFTGMLSVICLHLGKEIPVPSGAVDNRFNAPATVAR